ncbi:MAG: indole-3-glycerol phosphate synthase TrpC [Rhodothermales bacterium]|nr:indole-3-glycerol phosphate synthase TrpC [Rhodothermales bacterium]
MNILDRIVVATRDLVAERRRETPPAALEALPGFHAPIRSLEQALRTDELAIIAEIKKASPSKGVIREDFDVAAIARAYAAGGASALSVLTEPLFFQGALANLGIARGATSIPLLRKDFIIDSYQLLEARAYGADAVLLIATILDRTQLHDLHQAASDLGLEALVEVYDAGELDRIDFTQVRILGVNNRDLRTFEVDLGHSARVFASAPASVVRVSESGIETAEDLAFVRRHGCDAALIGESFMRAADPGARLAEVRAGLRALLASST